MRSGWPAGPGSVALSSNDNGCEGVIKRRTDAPRASVSLVLPRLTEACRGGVAAAAAVGSIRTILRLRLCQL